MTRWKQTQRLIWLAEKNGSGRKPVPFTFYADDESKNRIAGKT